MGASVITNTNDITYTNTTDITRKIQCYSNFIGKPKELTISGAITLVAATDLFGEVTATDYPITLNNNETFL